MDDTVGDEFEGPRPPRAAPGPRPRLAEAGGTLDRIPPELRAALRLARIEDAERSRAIADLRGAEIARLDMLREAIEPVLAALPADIEMFDAGLIPVPRPRLFIDMIAFVEMAHDRRTYRFVQDTRRGRSLLAESERVEAIRDAVTGYVARRLVEREKALADPGVAAVPGRPPEEPARFSWLRTSAGIALNYLGIASLCVLAWVLGHALYHALVASTRP